MKIRTTDAIAHYGNAAKLAKALGVSRSAISQWGEFLPEGRAYQAQHLTQNALPIQPATESPEAA